MTLLRLLAPTIVDESARMIIIMQAGSGIALAIASAM